MKKTKEEQNKKMPKCLHLRVVQIDQQQTKVKNIYYMISPFNIKLK
jgi:hypothetical protein